VNFDKLEEYKDAFKDLDAGFYCMGIPYGEANQVGILSNFIIILLFINYYLKRKFIRSE
jgi:hypothetical protein